ncbi:hypothetical protein AGRA3207_000881 [Actinomadura graeca]|uniref:FtsH ternary system domain-containing protein n=1 Tax=Actinomadura graeca TaxID=2750812 RepID=A0ABX8QNN2_9ACTN|nr:hypothetical protein [Actinomadura graeca]QXJ20208.1 hypothetical protein AGRA3207_000881 [Actinomadura graeca]
MRVRVRFRYDPETGRVETFRVDDVSAGPQEAGHDDEHDRIAAEIAGVVERGALIEEVAPGQAAAAPRPLTEDDGGEQERERGRDA